MKIIAVMSPKGGIGKTTTSDAIAYMLGEEQEKRVLILDGDPQGDTSKTFEAYEPEGTGICCTHGEKRFGQNNGCTVFQQKNYSRDIRKQDVSR